MSTNTCLWCARTVKHTVSDGNRANGSTWMLVNDKQDLFCSLRCAASYGISKATLYDARAAQRPARGR